MNSLAPEIEKKTFHLFLKQTFWLKMGNNKATKRAKRNIATCARWLTNERNENFPFKTVRQHDSEKFHHAMPDSYDPI